ncbi:hypothetical protein IGI04_030078 [Brassica rapa subsp. trilocularis]|uniref:Uncharacterized protein n=1 Tax=Brassica rapa subsp. trilocularis TaxID=1813537 RepID=A0ABQ7LPR5_BRACM|nr:hypothetical protein IGI04_030078 [Brassica rapa subsp. trilocularis]
MSRKIFSNLPSCNIVVTKPEVEASPANPRLIISLMNSADAALSPPSRCALISTLYPEKKRFTTAEKGKQKESEQLPADTPAAVPPREYTPKVPYSVPAKATRKDREEMKCRKMLEDLTVRLPLMDAIQMMPAQLYEGIDLRENII